MQHPWSPQQFKAAARKLGRSIASIEAANSYAVRIKRSDPNLPVILTLSHLAHLSDVAPQTVYGYVTREREREPYRVFRLKKRSKPASNMQNRRFRTICVPEPELMRLQRWIAQNILSQIAPHPASFAYYRDGGVLEAAQRHAGCTWLVKMDIKDFFESISESQVYRVFRSLGYGALLSFELARICTRVEDTSYVRKPQYRSAPYRYRCEGRLPQGAPTSPALANLVVRNLDIHLEAAAAKLGWTYTRYADDLAFSTRAASTREEARKVVALVKAALPSFGLDPNDAKTVIAPPGARRIVLGLLVDGPQPRLTRNFRDNLETHLHALTAQNIGPEKHRASRGFASTIGMRRHIFGLLAFAHYVEPTFAKRGYDRFNSIVWSG
jgi:RNA-directed DNA polymerase